MSKGQKLIDDYLAAYRAANGRTFAGSLDYENGWFVFRMPYTDRKRRKDVEHMIMRLNGRATEP